MSMPGMSGMSGTGMSGGQQGSMTSFLHFSPLSDTLWFEYWVPSSPGALFGACLGLFLLAIFERWLVASRAVAERSWSRSAQLAMVDRLNRFTKEPIFPAQDPSQAESKRTNLLLGTYIPPFIPSHDITRGILQVAQTALTYLFMLAAMTFQLSFIIAICIGSGVGEMMFGRYMSGASHH